MFYLGVEIATYMQQLRIQGSILIQINVCSIPAVPFQNARGPSVRRILLKQSTIPLYVCWPFLAFTCSLVLMTSAGVRRPAAGTPVQQEAENFAIK